VGAMCCVHDLGQGDRHWVPTKKTEGQIFSSASPWKAEKNTEENGTGSRKCPNLDCEISLTLQSNIHIIFSGNARKSKAIPVRALEAHKVARRRGSRVF
jgi:hypothetical protein